MSHHPYSVKPFCEKITKSKSEIAELKKIGIDKSEKIVYNIEDERMKLYVNRV